MTALSLLPGPAVWRSRKVQYYAGDWTSIQTVLPEFDLKPFTAGQDEPPNPFLQTVMREPLSAAELPYSSRHRLPNLFACAAPSGRHAT